jgi:hypothetical protein
VRTGSTVLAEALTQYPYSFIFREPRLLTGDFILKQQDIDVFADLGVNLKEICGNWSGKSLTGEHPIQSFFRDLLPAVLLHYRQIGIKEIYHEQWARLFDAIPDIKVIVTCRDPRDIYISLMEMRRYYKDPDWKWHRMGLSEMVDVVMPEFLRQREIVRTADAIVVKYEDLCTDPEEFARIRKHVATDIPDMGEIGYFNSNYSNRTFEVVKHGRGLSPKSVGRWRYEEDESLLVEALRFADQMKEYREFFQYE